MHQKRIYNQVWKEIYEDNPRPFLEYKTELIKPFLEKNKGFNALDIGCGDGFFTFKVLELGYRVDAMDVSVEAIRSTEERIKKLDTSEYINIFNKDLFEFESRKKYDVILCLEVLEHIKDDIKALKRINSLLKKDGLLILSVPHRQDLWNYSDEVGGHYRRYSKVGLTEKLKHADFEIDKIFDYGFPFIRSFTHGFSVPLAKRQNSQITPPRNTFFNRMLSKILRNMCKIDSLFLNNDRGITLIAIARKKMN